MDQHTGGECIIYGAKHYKDREEYPILDYTCHIKELCSTMFKPIF